MRRNHARLIDPRSRSHPVLGVAGAGASPSADSWLRDSRTWQVLHGVPVTSGFSWHALFSRWCSTTKAEHVWRNHARMSRLATPQVPRRLATWPQVVVHLKPPPCTRQVFRNRSLDNWTQTVWLYREICLRRSSKMRLVRCERLRLRYQHEYLPRDS